MSELLGSGKSSSMDNQLKMHEASIGGKAVHRFIDSQPSFHYRRESDTGGSLHGQKVHSISTDKISSGNNSRDESGDTTGILSVSSVTTQESDFLLAPFSK